MKIPYALIGLLCLVTSGFYLQTAIRRGVMDYDEAYYLLEAKGLRDVLGAASEWLRASHPRLTLRERIRQEGGIFPPGKPMPAFSALLTLWTLLPAPADLLVRFLSLIMAAATALLLFFILQSSGVRREDAFAGAAFLWLSPLTGYYATSGYPHFCSTFFFTAGLFCLVKERPVLAAFMANLCITTHYGNLPAAGLVMLWAAGMAMFRKGSAAAKTLAVCSVLAAFFLPLVAWEVLYRTVQTYLRGYTHDLAFFTYFQQWSRQVQRAAPHHLSFFVKAVHDNALLYYGLLKSQGLLSGISALLLTVGACFSVRILRRAQRLLVGVSTILILFWGFNPGTVVSRIAVFLLPGFALCVGIALSQIPLKAPWQRVKWGALCFVLGSAAFGSCVMQLKLRSPYPALAAALIQENHQEQIVDPFGWPIWQYYTARRQIIRPESAASPSSFISALDEAAAGLDRIPFAIGRVMSGKDLPGRIGGFYITIFNQPPDLSASMPYSALPVFIYEESPSNGPGKTRASLDIHWISLRLLKRELLESRS